MTKWILFIVLLLGSLGFSCNKRSACPTYWDSDPKILFGEITMEERLKRQQATDKKGQKVPGLGKEKKRKKR